MTKARCMQLLFGVVLGAALFGVAQPMIGQAPDCTYDGCALRIRSGRILQGRSGASLARLGMIPARVAVLAEGNDSTRAHYQIYRARQRTGSILGVVGVVVGLVGSAILNDDSDDDFGIGLLVGGFGFTMGGSLYSRSAVNHMSDAAWWYNRDFTLPR